MTTYLALLIETGRVPNPGEGWEGEDLPKRERVGAALAPDRDEAAILATALHVAAVIQNAARVAHVATMAELEIYLAWHAASVPCDPALADDPLTLAGKRISDAFVEFRRAIEAAKGVCP